jgi:hypothetical protein
MGNFLSVGNFPFKNKASGKQYRMGNFCFKDARENRQAKTK